MTSYLAVRNNKTGYVSFVGKERVAGSTRTTEYVCGLGSMNKEQFEVFKKWAHSIKDQEERKAQVLNCGLAVSEREAIQKRVKVGKAQLKTTVKPARKVSIRKPKTTVRKHYPVRPLKGYERQQTHTEMMGERKKQQKQEEHDRAVIAGTYIETEPEPEAPRMSKFSSEGIEFARQSKKALARERIRR